MDGILEQDPFQHAVTCMENITKCVLLRIQHECAICRRIVPNKTLVCLLKRAQSANWSRSVAFFCLFFLIQSWWKTSFWCAESDSFDATLTNTSCRKKYLVRMETVPLSAISLLSSRTPFVSAMSAAITAALRVILRFSRISKSPLFPRKYRISSVRFSPYEQKFPYRSRTTATPSPDIPIHSDEENISLMEHWPALYNCLAAEDMVGNDEIKVMGNFSLLPFWAMRHMLLQRHRTQADFEASAFGKVSVQPLCVL